MNRNAERLFAYLRDMIYDPAHASLAVEELDEDFRDLGKGLQFFAAQMKETQDFAANLARGDLSANPPPRGNQLAAPLKALHASLRHMTWQSQQVAKGDYRQRVDFMGDFAEAFNTMIQQLDARQTALEEEMEHNRQKTIALEQSHSLMTDITANISQQIMVMGRQTGEMLYANKAAVKALRDAYYSGKLKELVQKEAEALAGGETLELAVDGDEADIRYYTVKGYTLQWSGQGATAYVVDDVTGERQYRTRLEARAYWDPLTNLHNRFYGMELLQQWVAEKREFVLVFVDLDNLKYVNDNFGHAEGDYYIMSAADYLREFSFDIEATRLGGDEFMLLAPGVSAAEAEARMQEICDRMREGFAKKQKAYDCNMSFGSVEVNRENTLSASRLLGIADERMYAVKRENKRNRAGKGPTG